MKALGIIGWSGSGKTTLITALLPRFAARGVTTSTIKHAHHDFQMDQPGKDSFLHRQAGAHEVIVANDAQFALYHEHPGRLGLEPLLRRLEPVDLVLVEGFKDDPFPKLEVHRPDLGRPPLWPNTEVVAVASNAALNNCAYPVLRLNQPETIADFVLRYFRLR
jgi:molybdopterin-guanine dinucleotide biosynthesis protein B